MRKKFNTAGVCIPRKHYMVNIKNKLEKITQLVENGDYFVINRPRQYGKTTTIYLLEQQLKDKYLVISTSFEGLGDDIFKSEELFSSEILDIFANSIEFTDEEKSKELRELGKNLKNIKEVSRSITTFIKNTDRKVILLIDEIDKSSNNQLFLSFLGMLRSKYLNREIGKDYTFESVILAGVHDIKNLKLRLRDLEDKKLNSPWNIAVDFDVDMSFDIDEISTMIRQYSDENSLNLDIETLSKEIYKFTNGYPFLVSRVCQIIDEKILNNRLVQWDKYHIQKAVKLLLEENNTLFDDLIKNIENNTELYEYLYNLLILNIPYVFNIDNPIVNMGVMFGYLDKDENNNTVVSNKIIRERVYNYLVSKNDNSVITSYNFKDNFLTEDNGLDMEKVLLRFQQFMKENYSTRDTEFLERHGVLLFLSFIKPIINGVGFDYKEVQISEERRLDIVIQYNNHKYVIETKIWHGNVAHEKGLNQLVNYLDIEGLSKGYLLIFNFNKGKNFVSGKYIINEKEIFEVRV